MPTIAADEPAPRAHTSTEPVRASRRVRPIRKRETLGLKLAGLGGLISDLGPGRRVLSDEAVAVLAPIIVALIDYARRLGRRTGKATSPPAILAELPTVEEMWRLAGHDAADFPATTKATLAAIVAGLDAQSVNERTATATH